MSQTKAQLLGPLVGSNIDVEGDLNFDSGTLKVDPTNDRVGIKNSNPTKTLDVGGDTQVADLYYTADYPTIRPSLDLVFDKVKRLDSRVTFTRTSTATYVDENGIIQTAAANEPRFDHNPTTGESLGLLIEESRTNLVTYSENFSQGWDTVRATVTLNQTTAPDGTLTADLLEPIVTTSGGYTRFYYSVTSGTTYTFSFFAKYHSSDFPYIFAYAAYEGVSGSGRNVNYFNIQNGTLGSGSGSTYVSHSIEDYGGGWYRCSMTTTADVTGNVPFIIFPAEGNNDISYVSDGAGGIYIWGAQLEQGSFPTSYIPTTGSTVTRSADVATITGDNFSSFYNPTEGTIFAEYQNPKSGDTNNRVWCMELNSNQTLNIIPDNNQVQGQYYNFAYEYNPGYVPATQTFNKVALGFQDNNTNLAVNGTIGEDDTSISLIDFRSGYFNIGRSQYYSPRELNGCIKRLTYYPRRLNNSQLQNITL
jgi:hypothetical protein